MKSKVCEAVGNNQLTFITMLSSLIFKPVRDELLVNMDINLLQLFVSSNS